MLILCLGTCLYALAIFDYYEAKDRKNKKEES